MPPRAKNTEQNNQRRAQIMHQYAIPKDTRAIIFINIDNASIVDFLEKAGTAMNITFLAMKNTDSILGADAYISDKENTNFQQLLENAIIPIISKNLADSYGLTEFNPMKFEGSAFIFENSNEFCILEKVVRYLENIRYPGDKRTLLENVKKTRIQK